MSDDAEPTTTTDDEPEPQACAYCGATSPLVHLDDGTWYCPAHRGRTNDLRLPAVDVEAFTPVEAVEYTDAMRTHLEPQATADPAESDVWARDPAVLMVAGLIIEGALDTFGADGIYGDPPLGWMPTGDGTIAVAEAGAILAVATIIEAADIEREPLRNLAAMFRGETTDNERDNSD